MHTTTLVVSYELVLLARVHREEGKGERKSPPWIEIQTVGCEVPTDRQRQPLPLPLPLPLRLRLRLRLRLCLCLCLPPSFVSFSPLSMMHDCMTACSYFVGIPVCIAIC